jgi:hypothetical protein
MAGVAAMTAEWLWVAAEAERRRIDRLLPLALPAAALLLAHVGAALLLYDAPVALAVVATALAGLGVAVLLPRRRELVAVPMAAAAITLAVADRTGAWSAVDTLTGAGAALAVYVIALLRGAWRSPRGTGAVTLAMVGGAAAAYAALAALALFPAQPHAFALVLLGLTVAQVALALAVARPLIGLVTAGAGLFGLGCVALRLHGGGTRLVAIVAAWSAIHVAACAWELVARRARPDPLRLAWLSAAALGLPLLTWGALGADGRALLATADAALLLAAGGLLLGRARAAATLLLGQGAALLALAAALHFSPAGSIVAWAILGTVIIALAAAAEDTRWLAGGLALIGLAAVALLPEQLTDHGQWRMPLLHNPRWLALAALGGALLAAARATAQVRTAWFSQATRALASAGHAALLTLLLTETADAVPDDARVLMLATLVLGVYAVALLAGGFAARSALHRYLGLGLFGVTLAKLALADVWTLQRAYQTVVFLGVGALLVAAGFLYARFGRRLLALLRDG